MGAEHSTAAAAVAVAARGNGLDATSASPRSRSNARGASMVAVGKAAEIAALARQRDLVHQAQQVVAKVSWFSVCGQSTQ